VRIAHAGDGLHDHTVGLFAAGTTCGIARRVARVRLRSPHSRPLRFTCSEGWDGVACVKGSRHVTWGYIDD
jgi:hypothetical protein